jgi:hypothetical protein
MLCAAPVLLRPLPSAVLVKRARTVPADRCLEVIEPRAGCERRRVGTHLVPSIDGEDSAGNDAQPAGLGGGGEELVADVSQGINETTVGVVDEEQC